LFDPAMTREAAPTARRGWLPGCSEAAIRTCLTEKAPIGTVLRQATGLVESPLRLIGPDRAEPDFGTLSRRPNALK
jgi:hypothetical protein